MVAYLSTVPAPRPRSSPSSSIGDLPDGVQPSAVPRDDQPRRVSSARARTRCGPSRKASPGTDIRVRRSSLRSADESARRRGTTVRPREEPRGGIRPSRLEAFKPLPIRPCGLLPASSCSLVPPSRGATPALVSGSGSRTIRSIALLGTTAKGKCDVPVFGAEKHGSGGEIAVCRARRTLALEGLGDCKREELVRILSEIALHRRSSSRI